MNRKLYIAIVLIIIIGIALLAVIIKPRVSKQENENIVEEKMDLTNNVNLTNNEEIDMQMENFVYFEEETGQNIDQTTGKVIDY